MLELLINRQYPCRLIVTEHTSRHKRKETIFNHLDKYTRPERDRCALVTIDLQNDFVLPNAPAEGKGAMQAARQACEMTDFCRDEGIPIIHVIRLYSPERGAETIDSCRRESVENGLALLQPHSKGSAPVSGLVPQGFRIDPDLLFSGRAQRISDTECVMYKPRWGCFHGTRLDSRLRKMNVSTLLISGTWFSNCVRTTIYEATARDYRTVALTDAIAGVYEKGLDDLARIKCGICTCRQWQDFFRR